MTTTEVTLTDQEQALLTSIVRQTGKTESEVLHEAVQAYLIQFEPAHRRHLLQQARGIWRDRTDIPDVRALRSEFDRY